MKLTKAQRIALEKLAETGDGSAYDMKVSVASRMALSSQRLAVPTGNGHMAFPRSARWRITDAGRRALSDGGRE